MTTPTLPTMQGGPAALNGDAYQTRGGAYQIVRYNEPPKAIAGMDARHKALLRDGHTYAVQLRGLFGGTPKDIAAWLTDVLRNRFSLFGPMARLINECARRLVPRRTAREPVERLLRYVDETYDEVESLVSVTHTEVR